MADLGFIKVFSPSITLMAMLGGFYLERPAAVLILPRSLLSFFISTYSIYSPSFYLS